MRVTAFSTNDQLRQLVKDAMLRDGVSAKRRSRWICAAVQSLFDVDPALNKVGQGDDLESYPDREVLKVDPATDVLIGRAFEILRGMDPRAEGIQAAVIRAAIRHASGGERQGGGRAAPARRNARAVTLVDLGTAANGDTVRRMVARLVSPERFEDYESIDWSDFRAAGEVFKEVTREFESAAGTGR